MAKIQHLKRQWAPYPGAADYSGLSTRHLENLVKDNLIESALVRRPGKSRGLRLINLISLDQFIRSGIGNATDMDFLSKNPKQGGRK